MSSKLDELIDELAKEFVKEEAAPEEQKESAERTRLKEFFFGKSELDNGFQDSLRRDGLCPYCAQPGRIHLSTFICDEHGPF